MQTSMNANKHTCHTLCFSDKRPALQYHPCLPITVPPRLLPPVQVKERAREFLARKYRSRALSEEDILHCLYSISDNNSYLLFNRDPIDRQAGRGGICTWNPKLGLCFACVRVFCSLVLRVCVCCVCVCLVKRDVQARVNGGVLNAARPVCRMIAYLQAYFSPSQFEQGYSLAIQVREGGSKKQERCWCLPVFLQHFPAPFVAGFHVIWSSSG